MVDVAIVKMFGNPIGVFRWDSRYDIVQFEYNKDFIGQGLEPSPLMMPVQSGRTYSFGDIGRETFKGLPGLLAVSLPDTYGRALCDRWLTLTGRTSSNIVETLCFLGKRCMGALEFEPAIDVDYNLDSKIAIDSLVEVAREALLNKENFGVNINDDKKAAITEILRLGTSAGGQRL
jgi:serine/threonine-protein kinase HipA